jgi:type I restriction enzyme M protein
MLLEGHIDKIIETFRKRETLDEYSRRVPTAEIVEAEFNLNISRYIDIFEAEEQIDVATVQAEIDGLEAELAQVRAEMNKILKELGIHA